MLDDVHHGSWRSPYYFFSMSGILVGRQGERTLRDILIVCPGKYGGKCLGVNLDLRAVNGTCVIAM